MKDIKGREIHNGDILLVGYKKNDIYIGVMIDDKIRSMKSTKQSIQPSFIYLLENPTKEEIDEKLHIENEIYNYKKEKKNKKKEYGTLIGGIYSTTNGKEYLYLGNLHIVEKSFDGKMIFLNKVGYVYVELPYEYRINTEQRMEYTMDLIKKSFSISIMNKPKVVTGMIGIDDNFKYTDYRNVIGSVEFEDCHPRKFKNNFTFLNGIRTFSKT